MKLTSNIQRSTFNAQCPARPPGSRLEVEGSLLPVSQAAPGHAARAPRRSERGIALVITLILLSVTLVMAIAFLAVSRRERGSVTTSTDTTTARLAADSALASAQAQIIANVLATNNPFDFGLLVSTNFINPFGFISDLDNPTNVNYEYANGLPLSLDDLKQNLANLLYLPRPPVFIITNQSFPNSNEFRYYLDLNRNGIFDASGDVPNMEYGLSGLFTNGTISAIGDPQWIGILERPDARYGPNNKFLARWAFIALPIGNTLDLNAIHNQALHGNGSPQVNLPPAGDAFLRNQGVGSWEINLAAFLADLNTNEWDTTAAPYKYLRPGSFPNTGNAFADACALLTYRYDNNYNSLNRVQNLFPNGALALANLPVDVYPFGGLMTSPAVPSYLNDPTFSWPGADNTNHYFALSSDLFDPAKTELNAPLPGFIDRLLEAGTNVTTYDRYTFYRLLGQLGTDSAPEQNKINLNYSNAVAYTDANGIVTDIVFSPNAETNLVPWQPLQFFTIAANQMLREYTTRWYQADPSNYLATYYNVITNYTDPTGFGLTNFPYFGLTNQVPAFGVTNIPVQVNGQFVYSAAVQRVLQLAANIYDATTNRAFAVGSGKNYPSVFRPIFYKSVVNAVTNVTIVGYQDVSAYSENAVLAAGTAPLDPPQDADFLPTGYTPLLLTQNLGNVYGVPWIIGAKKGFPSFNEFSMESAVQVTRKLLLSRTNSSASSLGGGLPMKLTATNQMYIFSITNYLGVELWNSYSNDYQGKNLQVVVNDNLSVMLTNGLSTLLIQSNNVYVETNFGAGTWPGWSNSVPAPGAVGRAGNFVLPLGASGTNLTFLPASIYRFGTAGFVPDDANPFPQYENFPITRLPEFGMVMTNRLQVFILDTDVGGHVHVIDYVHFNGPDRQRDLNAELADEVSTGGIPAYQWSTNLFGTVPWGVINQINLSQGLPSTVPSVDGGNWNSPQGLPPALVGRPGAVQEYFKGFLVPNSLYSFGGKNYTNMEYVVQAPYTPTRTIVDYVSWQANDPLVRSLSADLNYSGANEGLSSKLVPGLSKWTTAPDILIDLGRVNQNYQPWGIVHSYAGSDNNPTNLAYKDPLAKFSDNWNFPTNKLPTVGWLGRVHRGSPWQTVYLKASNILKGTNGLTTWSKWTGYSNLQNITNTAPLQDRALFDLFSTALNDNATRGRMPVNVGANGRPGLAAWAALFSGIAVPPASLTNTYQIIDPAGVDQANSRLYQVVTNINTARANFTNADGVVGSFERVGDILSASALSERSPFLNLANTNYNNDELYEWLPQQTMSLLTVSSAPRYVIYSYGQTLTPAPNAELTSGGAAYFGMITNYQVVSEIVTRSVVQFNPVITRDAGGNLKTNYNAHVEQFNILPPD